MEQREGTYSACIIRPVMQEHEEGPFFKKTEAICAEEYRDSMVDELLVLPRPLSS